MPVDSPGLGTWQIVKPQAATNLVTNPSFEVDTVGWTTSLGTLTRTVGAGVFGTYGGRLLASAQFGNSAMVTASIASGTLLVASSWVKATSALVYLQLSIGANTVTVFHPGDGLWHRLEISTTAPSTTTASVTIADSRVSAWTNVDIDGVMLETGVTAATTYVDGDQDGCLWSGSAHGSTSSRDARDPRGGALASFASAGWTEKTWGGIGAPDINTIDQDLAIADGSLYQNQIAKPRVITLSVLAQVANLAALHAARRALLDICNPNTRTSRGPVRLRYAGAATVKTIDAVNESGFGFEKPYHQRAEMAELRFFAPDPIWQRETEEMASLTNLINVSSVSKFAIMSPTGVWSNFGAGAAAAPVSGQMFGAVQLLDGRIVVAGALLDIGGVAANDNLAVWDGTSWATLGGNAPSSTVMGLTLSPDGRLWICGADGMTVGGITTHGVAYWTPATNAWTSVSASLTGGAAIVGGVVWDPLNSWLWAFGNYTAINGVASANGAAIWTGAAWLSASAGLPGFPVSGPTNMSVCMIGPDGRVYTSSAGGTGGLWAWSNGTFVQVAAAGGTALYSMASIGGRIYVGGQFTTIGGYTVSSLAVSTGTGWQALGSGLSASSNVLSIARAADGFIYVAGGGWGTVGGITPLDSMAAWTGSTWLPFACFPPVTGTHANDYYKCFSLRDGSLIVNWIDGSGAGTFGTTLSAQGITTVTNSGSADAYPIIYFGPTGPAHSIANLTTGQFIGFDNLTIAAGELGKLDLRPNRKSFSSLLRNMMPMVLPGGDLATFRLVPGANRIASFNGGTMAMSWRPRDWSVD